MARSTLRTLCPRRSYDFSSLTSFGKLTYPIAKNIPVSPWSTGAVLVRVHALSAPLGASVVLRIFNSLPSHEDPDEDFTEPSPLSTATVSATPPGLQVVELDLADASFLTIMIVGTASLGLGTPSATLSLDLVARALNQTMHCVLPKTSFDFSSTSGTTTVVAGRLCGFPARTPVRLLLRVHAIDLGSVKVNAIELRLRPTVEVPGATCWFPTAEPWLVVAAAGPAPNLVIAAQSRPLPPSLCAEVVATSGGTSVSATLSADLIV